MNSIINLARPEIIALTAYSSARNEVSAKGIWLNANENPFSLTAGNSLNRYPQPQPIDLVEKLSNLLNIKRKQLLVTRGSDEGIDLLVRAFCKASVDSIMICPPTYGMYEISANIQGAKIVEVPLMKEQGFNLDFSRMIENWNSKVKIIFICSPNNPTGNLLDNDTILQLCKIFTNKALIVVDEAYIDFSGSDGLNKYLNVYPNLIILRTLSKAYAMAGARCGMLLANPDIINLMKKIIAPYPLSELVVTQVCLYLTKAYQNKVKHYVNMLITQRDILENFLKKLPKVKRIWPSDANFLLLEVNDVNAWITCCANNKISIRDRSAMLNLNNCVRISIGTPEENQQLMRVLKYV